ncbi:uncharacterized protein YndB with AHSA1/START domain [Arthrobacter sp. 1088]|uniref:SRPBCC family protein n=1 Tax=unclassified Arthrobacter TaxID=235627 RepID=UPI001CC47296|nr:MULTISPECIES: SRPBCC domain-containing protein [unclassified Arthrobacter]MDR6687321.1 uncharacterized protein YndB with AHSA1/START domain [Arthrobacter sp. 1088]BCW52005.1 hypothetical protein StoSoilB13_43470 [Arthrobacter sp. StoSoilB13]
MATFRVTTLVAAPPERVFATWTDPDRFQEWIGGVTRVTDRTGSIDQVGSRYTVWFGRMASPTEILAVERPWHIRTRFGNAILKGESDVRFAPEAGGTRIHQEFVTRGFIAAIFGRIFAMGSYRGSFRGELETFRRLVEREATEPGTLKPGEPKPGEPKPRGD